MNRTWVDHVVLVLGTVLAIGAMLLGMWLFGPL
jgi:hypothetical protein